jgi:amino acid transporter
MGGVGAEQFGQPQIGAATTTVLAGAILWGLKHGTAFGRYEEILALGAVCAIAAAGVQSAIGFPQFVALASRAKRKQKNIGLGSPSANGSLPLFSRSPSFAW